MKFSRLNALQKSPHRCLFPPFKPSALSPNLPSTIKSIHSFTEFDGKITQAILNLIQKGNFSPTSNTYSKLLSECINNKSLFHGKQIHAHITKSGFLDDTTLGNHLINLYFKCRVFEYARKVFDKFPDPDLVSWSSLISGYSQNGLCEEALLAFHDMNLSGVKCNHFTFPSVLKAGSITKDLKMGKEVHGMVVKTGFDPDVFVANALVVIVGYLAPISSTCQN